MRDVQTAVHVPGARVVACFPGDLRLITHAFLTAGPDGLSLPDGVDQQKQCSLHRSAFYSLGNNCPSDGEDDESQVCPCSLGTEEGNLQL